MTSATSSWKSVPLVTMSPVTTARSGAAIVGRARPGEPPRAGRERPDVQVRQLRDAQPFEPRVEPRHAERRARRRDTTGGGRGCRSRRSRAPRGTRTCMRSTARGAAAPRARSTTGATSVATTAGMSVQRHAHQWMKYGMSTRRTMAGWRPRRSGIPARARPTKSSDAGGRPATAPMSPGAGQPSRRAELGDPERRPARASAP